MNKVSAQIQEQAMKVAKSTQRPNIADKPEIIEVAKSDDNRLPWVLLAISWIGFIVWLNL